MSPLQVQNLVKDYGSLRAVKNVSFELRPGEIFGLLGPNGAGKTSIINCIVTLERPTSGHVNVFGQDVQLDGRAIKSQMGLVPQEIINHGFFTSEEILHFHSGYFGRRQNKKRVDYLLERLGLWEHRKKRVKQLSGGMKRRLLIAKALVHEPKLLLLDEPTAGVDIELRASLWDFVRDLRNEGTTILLTTHYLEEAEELCDRVGILSQGEIKQLGPTADLIRERTFREVHFELNEEVLPFEHAHLIRHEKDRLVFKLPAHHGVGDLIAETSIDFHKVIDVRIQEGDLEDAFRSVLEEKS